MELPYTDEIKGLSKGDVAKMLYDGQTIDFALPQLWVMDCLDRGFDPRPCVVWLYKMGTPGGYSGEPAPLTVEAKYMLDMLAGKSLLDTAKDLLNNKGSS